MDQITPPSSVSWQAELAERKSIAREIGGPERIAGLRQGRRPTVRERIDQCLDMGSFPERAPLRTPGQSLLTTRR